MKKLIIISLLLVAACSKSNDSSEAPKNPPIPTTDPTANPGNMSLGSVKMFADQAW